MLSLPVAFPDSQKSSKAYLNEIVIVWNKNHAQVDHIFANRTSLQNVQTSIDFKLS